MIESVFESITQQNKTTMKKEEPIKEEYLPKKEYKSRKTNQKWTKSETKILMSLSSVFNNNWELISEFIKNKSASQCRLKYDNQHFRKRRGHWTQDEDNELLRWVKVHGPNKWFQCSKRLHDRCANQCKERYVNVLNPKIVKGNWTREEEIYLFEMIEKHGLDWKGISRLMAGRATNAIKNKFYIGIRKIKKLKFFVLLKFKVFEWDVFYSKEKYGEYFDKLIEAVTKKDQVNLEKYYLVFMKEVLDVNYLVKKLIFYLFNFQAKLTSNLGRILMELLFDKKDVKKSYIQLDIIKEHKAFKFVQTLKHLLERSIDDNINQIEHIDAHVQKLLAEEMKRRNEKRLKKLRQSRNKKKKKADKLASFKQTVNPNDKHINDIMGEVFNSSIATVTKSDKKNKNMDFEQIRLDIFVFLFKNDVLGIEDFEDTVMLELKMKITVTDMVKVFL